MVVHLRPLALDDEFEFRRACRDMDPPDFDFAFGWDDEQDFAEYLDRLERERAGSDLAEGRVPSSYLVGVVAGRIVGRVSIRHTLNERLIRDGGHIGYGVLPSERGQGLAREMLRQALAEARRLGIERALLTCDATNMASIRVIEQCGGQFRPTAADRETGFRRYWIPTAAGSHA